MGGARKAWRNDGFEIRSEVMNKLGGSRLGSCTAKTEILNVEEENSYVPNSSIA